MTDPRLDPLAVPLPAPMSSLPPIGQRKRPLVDPSRRPEELNEAMVTWLFGDPPNQPRLASAFRAVPRHVGASLARFPGEALSSAKVCGSGGRSSGGGTRCRLVQIGPDLAQREGVVDIEVRAVDKASMPDAERVFGSHLASAGCFCMWFLIPVAQYHAGGAAENRRRFEALVDESDTPAGLIAYSGGEPVGWCAAGPRSRFVRALRVPSFKGRDPGEDESVWLVPCFNVAPDARRSGVSRALLDSAVALARQHGATAIEGFPFARDANLGRESMVGLEATFDACGFSVSRRPSASRVVMRLDLGGRPQAQHTS